MLKTEGIILNGVKFQDYDQIITIFTPSEGILKLIVKGGLRVGKENLTSPFTRAEFIYIRKKSELCTCKEISLLHQHLSLRKDIDTLEAASELLQAIIATQMPQKMAPEIYQLLASYLEKLPHTSSPFTLATSFKLKVLRYEGLLHLKSHCSSCHIPLNAKSLFEGETYCFEHAPPSSLDFTEEEALFLDCLALARSYGELFLTTPDPLFHQKVKRLFLEMV